MSGNMTKLTFTLLLFLVSLSGLAENWNPFPFKVAYYGKRYDYLTSNESQRPFTTGWLIDGLYLDDSTVSGDTLTRTRSAKYFAPNLHFYPEYFGSDKPFIGKSTFSVSPSTGYCQLSSDFPAISFRYFPNRVKIGLSPMEGMGKVDSILVEPVFGIMDSVAYLNGGLKWGKIFGIIQSQGIALEAFQLMGVGDLNLGWKNNVGKIKAPKPGDEFHFWKSEIGGYTCTTMLGNYSQGVFQNKWLKIKLLSIGQGFNPLYEVIESFPGASTGILYHQYIQNFEGGSFTTNVTMDSDSIYPIGVWGNLTNRKISSIGFASDSGQQFVVKKQFGLDSDHLKSYFISCSGAPLSYFFDFYPLLWVPGFCDGGSINIFNYPVFTKGIDGCRFGTPFPDVVITENRGLIQGNELLYLFPNPVDNEFSFSNGYGGYYSIYDKLGRKVLSGIVSNEPISATDLPSGIFHYIVEYQGKTHHGRLIRH